ncbi:MAG: hypothetical protein Q8O55_00670 [Dehalococcoidales bacterium]|nr:hypothetical protein [Dehalococcoidales bacterium]
MPGTHYVITSGMVPAVDGELIDVAANVIGNKADTAILVKDDVSSAMRYLKGLMDAAGPGGIIQGGVFRGEVTTYTDTTHFKVAALAGQGTGAFIPVAGAPYEIFVFQADGGAPEGEQTPVVAYTSSDGTFEHAALTVPLAAGDIVLIIHPLIASLGTKATTGAIGAVTTTDYIAAYIKQLITNTYRLTEAADGIDVFPASVAEDSLFAKLLGKGNPALGTSFDNTTDSLEALSDAIAVVAGYLDTEIAAILAAVDTEVAALVTSKDRQLFSMDFWSVPQEEVAIPAVGAAATLTLPTVTIADLPAGATIVRAIAMLKCRIMENTNVAANKLSGATVADTSQVIQVRDDTPGTWRDAIKFVDDQFGIAASTREGGDVLIGDTDIAVEVDANDGYNFQYLLAAADVAALNLNDVQVGLRIWYSV